MEAPSRYETLQTLRVSLYDVAFSTAFGTLYGGAFMVGFIQSCHGGDVWLGFISAIGSLFGILQIPGAIWGRSFTAYKKFILPGGLSWRLLYIPIAFLPILAFTGNAKLIIASALIVVASAAVQVVNPIYTDWLAEIVPPTSRGAYFTKRNAIATGVGSALGIVGGFILDHFQSHGGVNLGLTIIFGLGALCGMISFYFFAKMSEQPRTQPIRQNIWEGIRSVASPFKDRNYRPLLIYLTVAVFIRSISGPYYAAFALDSLQLPFSVIMICGAMQSLSIIIFSPLVGFFSDKYGNKPILVLGGIFVAVNPFLWAMARDNQLVFDIIYLLCCHLFFGISWAVIGPAEGNLMLQAAPDHDRANYLGAGNAISAVIAGIAPIAGSLVLVFLREHVITGGGAAYRVFFIACGFLRFGALLFLIGVREEGAAALKTTISQIVQTGPRSMRAARKLDQPATPDEREATIAVLAKQPSAMGVQGLVRALEDPLPRVRRKAADALTKLDHSQVQTELILAVVRHIKAHPELVEEETLEAIGGFGKFRNVSLVLDPLVELLQSPRGPIKRAAAHALGRLGLREAIPALCGAVQAGDRDTRRAALQALRVLEADEAEDTIVEALKDRGPSVSTAAAEAVADLALTHAGPILRQLLSEPLPSATNSASSSEMPASQNESRAEASDEVIYQRPWESLAYALACIGDENDLQLILSASKRVRTVQSRQTILLAAARLFGCESSVYRVLLTKGFDRESSLMELVKHQFRRFPEIRDILIKYSDEAHQQGSNQADADAIRALAKALNLNSMNVFEQLAQSGVRESFVIAAAIVAQL